MIEITSLTQEDIDQHLNDLVELDWAINEPNLVGMIERFQATFSFQKAQSG